MTKKLIKNKWKCLYCNDIIESKRQHHFISCKCGKTSIDGLTSYIRLIGDLDMMQDVCERIEVWEDGDKIRCIERRRPTSYIENSKNKKSSLETFRNEWDT